MFVKAGMDLFPLGCPNPKISRSLYLTDQLLDLLAAQVFWLAFTRKEGEIEPKTTHARFSALACFKKVTCYTQDVHT